MRPSQRIESLLAAFVRPLKDLAGPEHLLLGLIREGEGVAAKVLGHLGVQLAALRAAVEAAGPGGEAAPGEIGLTGQAKHAIEGAVDEARRMGHHYIGTEHLLLGLIRQPAGALGSGRPRESVAITALRHLGVDLDAIRAQTIQILSQSTPPSTATGWQGRGGAWHTTSAGQAPADLGALRRVVPLAQTHDLGLVTVSALSLEDYGHGFRLLLRVLGRDPAPPTVSRLLFARAGLVATDDRGGRYLAVHVDSRGGLREQRIELDFTSALDVAARQLQLELAPIDQQGPVAVPPPSAAFAPAGPWTLTLTLPG